jgi:hypothetical protein
VKDGGGAPDPLAVRPGSRRELGRFVLRGGRTLRLEAAETLAGKSCLLEVDVSGTATSCLDGGLFALHRAAFGVSSEGGPDRFTALRLAGVAAPEIASITLVRTDGSSVELGLSRRQAFVYEAAEAELAAGVLPAALVLEARSGRVVEEIAIPAVG